MGRPFSSIYPYELFNINDTSFPRLRGVVVNNAKFFFPLTYQRGNKRYGKQNNITTFFSEGDGFGLLYDLFLFVMQCISLQDGQDSKQIFSSKKKPNNSTVSS